MCGFVPTCVSTDNSYPVRYWCSNICSTINFHDLCIWSESQGVSIQHLFKAFYRLDIPSEALWLFEIAWLGKYHWALVCSPRTSLECTCIPWGICSTFHPSWSHFQFSRTDSVIRPELIRFPGWLSSESGKPLCCALREPPMPIHRAERLWQSAKRWRQAALPWTIS